MKPACFLLVLVALTGCDETKPPPLDQPPVSEAATSPSEPSETAPSAPEESEPELSPEFPSTDLGEIPTFEDLELEASRTVAVQNLEAELDRLEAEIVEFPN